MYRREINKYIKQNCAPSCIYLRDYSGMHGQQNIKFYYYLFVFGATPPSPPVGQALLILEVSRSHSDAPQSVEHPLDE